MSHRIEFVLTLLLLSDKVISGISAETNPLDNCGQRTALTQGLVSHGDQSRLGEWPWHAAILQRINQSSPSYACGGTIITSSFILTAAHCTLLPTGVRYLHPSELLIRAGISNLQQVDHSLQQISVEKITVHEDYQSDKFVNDIAVLKVSGSLEFTDYVKPICVWRDVADESLIVGKQGYVSGWGLTERGEVPDQLQHAAMPIVSRKDCRASDRKYYDNYLFDWKCFCAGFRNGTSPGSGDSGGGLYMERGGKWILRGVVSSGKFNRARQLDTFSYIVFADVAHFLSWIDNKTEVSRVEAVQPVENFFTCGKKPEQQFSRAGVVEEEIWPWNGNVYREGQNPTWLCQTAVINENFVLSPAAPFDDTDIYNASQIMVIFTSRGSKNKQFVHRIIRHPIFDRQSPTENLALLELKIPLMFSDLIRPICLWTAEHGAVHINGINVGNNCVTKFHLNSTMLGNHSMCQYYGTTETTMPDLLYVQYKDSWYLRGVSFNLIKRRKKQSKKFYIVAVDLAYYKNWIEENAVVKSKNLFSHNECLNDDTYNWVYEIHVQETFQCYGSLILHKLLLTIASCVDGTALEDLLISQSNFESGVENFYLHPSFDKQQFTNNIAVVKMATSELTEPICIPNSFTPLPHLELSVLHNEVSHTFTTTGVKSCAQRWQGEGARVMTNGQHICGLIQSSAKVPLDCTANLNGAPLVYYSDDGATRYLRGLLDIGKKDHCENSVLPEVFIDVMFYVDGIGKFAAFPRNEVWKNEAPRKESPGKEVSSESAKKQYDKATSKLTWSQMALGGRI